MPLLPTITGLVRRCVALRGDQEARSPWVTGRVVRLLPRLLAEWTAARHRLSPLDRHGLHGRIMLGKTESHWRQHGLDHFSHLPHALSRLEKETKGTLVLITGTLQRHGHEAACSVVARKHASTHGPIYTDCCVLQAPGSLDDGVYTLTFRGYSALTEKASGLWLSVDEFKVE